MPRYFQYMISPKQKQSSTLISIRVDEDTNTITCYSTRSEPGLLNKIPLVGQFLPGNKKTSYYFLAQCYKQYQDELRKEGLVMKPAHFYTDPHKKFLKSLKKCEATKEFPLHEKLLTKKVIKEIVAAYKQFRADPYDPLPTIVSNNLNYQYPLPGVKEHYAGIMAGNPSSYLPNPALKQTTSPADYLPTRTTPEVDIKDAATLLVGFTGLALLGARKFGLFGRPAKQEIKPEPSTNKAVVTHYKGRSKSHTA